MRICVADRVGAFAENKDQARSMRLETLSPQLRAGNEVVLDFAGVTGATQSFVHALIADLIRDENLDALDYLVFENCADVVRSVIEIVVGYAQDEWETDEERASSEV